MSPRLHRLPPRLVRLLARAGRLYGVPPDLFWRLTPAELKHIERDWLDEQRAREEEQRAREDRADRRTARLMAAIYNTAGKTVRGSVTEDDFLPRRDEPVSADDLYAKARLFEAMWKAKNPENN